MTLPSYWIRADLSSAARIREFESRPLAARGLPASTYELLAAACRHAPQAIAIRYMEDPADTVCPPGIRYDEMLARVHQMADLIRREGVGRHDTVSLLLANTPPALYALWGGQTVAVVNPINWMLEAEAIAAILAAAGTRMLMAYGGDAQTPIWDKVLEVVARCPQLKTVVRLGGDRRGAAPAGVRFLDYDADIDRYDATPPATGQLPQGGDLAALFPTGGTTGDPKLVRLSHANIVASAWLSAVVAGISEGERRLSATPLYHVVGAFAGCLATVARGACVVLATSAGWRHPQLLPRLGDVLRTCGIHYLTIVPTIMNQLVQGGLTRADLASVKGVMSGSAPLSEAVAERFLALSGLPVREGYGMTETTSVCMMNPAGGLVKTGSVGLLFPYHRARVVDEQGRDCAPGRSGLLWLAGPTIAAGYAGGGALPGDGAQWLDTGDLARIDEDGYIWITGRRKDLIIRGGHNIDPKAVEEVFYRHPLVQEAAVVARPDSYAGEVPVAYVQLRPGARIDAQALLQAVRAVIAERAAVPKDCYIVENLPRSPVGKILKHRLREDATLRGFEKTLQEAGLLAGVRLQLEPGTALRILRQPGGPSAAQLRAALATFTTPYSIEPAEPGNV